MEVNKLSHGGQNLFMNDSSVQSLNNRKTVNIIDPNSKISQNNEQLKSNGVKEKKIDEQEVKKAVEKLNKLLEGRETHVEYVPVGKAKHMGIKIVDNETKEVVQELPPRKIVEMIDKLCELAGIMVDERV